ncbi:MAG: capsular biosynthesis protein [Bacteroidia bacterium]|jgi:tyrosine-protein phosphatase YwqE|nr:capsular biosynthesis protein [Bacteroidia bacterium]
MFKHLFSSRPKLASSGFINPVRVELHSHLIPAIDDGVQSLEESIAVLEHMHHLGYKKVITTPHIMADFYKNSSENILPALTQINQALKEKQIPLVVEAAAEYMIDDGFERKIDQGNLLTFGKNYVLIELPFMSEPPNFKSALFSLRVNGYKPVLAHPERYGFMAMKPDKYIELFEQGVLLQVNLFSLIGYYSPQIKKTAEWLLKEKVLSFVGSDCHGVRHLPVLNDALRCKNYELLCEQALLNNELI